MNELVIKNGKVTSLDLVKEINLFRAEIEGKNELAHSDLLKIIRDEFDDEINGGEFSCVEYKDAKGELRPMFELTLSQAKQVLVRESKMVRKAVIKRLEELENGVPVKVPTTFREALLLAAEQQLVIEQQEAEIKKQKSEIEYKSEVIAGVVDDVDIATMRTIFNRVVRMGQTTGESVQSRYTNIYRLFREMYHIDLKARMEGACLKAGKKTLYKSVVDYADKNGYMRNLYNICVKYYETDVQTVLDDLVNDSKRE